MLKTISQSKKTSILHIGENLSLQNASEVKDRIVEILKKSNLDILWIDMSNVDFVDGAGLGVIATVHKLAQRKGCQVMYCKISPSVRLVLEITGLDQILRFSEQLPTLNTK